jgi:hypothetical protein
MKSNFRLANWRLLLLTMMVSLMQLTVWAQENNSESSSTTTTTTRKVDISVNSGDAWYTNPIVWVIGAAVFILLLVALLRGGGGRTTTASDRITVTKTVERDTDV